MKKNNLIEGLNWKKKQKFCKRNKNKIKNQKNGDWNWKTKNKEDNHALIL
jgi:hypothetical protein